MKKGRGTRKETCIYQSKCRQNPFTLYSLFVLRKYVVVSLFMLATFQTGNVSMAAASGPRRFLRFLPNLVRKGKMWKTNSGNNEDETAQKGARPKIIPVPGRRNDMISHMNRIVDRIDNPSLLPSPRSRDHPPATGQDGLGKSEHVETILLKPKPWTMESANGIPPFVDLKLNVDTLNEGSGKLSVTLEVPIVGKRTLESIPFLVVNSTTSDSVSLIISTDHLAHIFKEAKIEDFNFDEFKLNMQTTSPTIEVRFSYKRAGSSTRERGSITFVNP